MQVDPAARTATVTVHAPTDAQPDSRLADILAAGADWWPLKMARELDDAILMLRSNELEIGTWILKTRGDSARVLEIDATLAAYQGHWFVRETLGLLRRTLARLDVSSRTLFAIIDGGSCFAGTLLELALAADRTYMLSAPERQDAPRIALSSAEFRCLPDCGPDESDRIALLRRDTDDRSAARYDRPLAEHRGSLGAGTDHSQHLMPSIGTTKSAWPSKSAPVSRRTR